MVRGQEELIVSEGLNPFDEFQRQFGRLLMNSIEQGTGRRLVRLYPLLNLYDRGEEFLLVAEVTGTSPEDIEVTISGDTVLLKGERKRREGVGDEAYRRQERVSGRWSRTVTLSEAIDADGVVADCVDGRLAGDVAEGPEGAASADQGDERAWILSWREERWFLGGVLGSAASCVRSGVF